MYRFDEDFDGFLQDFGTPHDSQPIPDSVIEAYRHKLPEQLFTYWRGIGASGFHNGLFWMTNPAEYQDMLDLWLDGTPFEERTDLSVIARSAFGELFAWGKGKGEVISINPNLNIIYHHSENDNTPLNADKEAFKMRCFWGFSNIEHLDITDEHEKPLFARALKKFGQLKPDEMYGFSHHLSIGGKELISNMEIVKLEAYHHIAQQLAPTQIIGIS